MNEQRAIALCLKHHDPAGFEFLVRQYRREAFVHAYALLGNPHDAEDACQECFAKAYGTMPGLAALDRFYPWFYRILRNHCLNALARRDTCRRNHEQAGARAAPTEVPPPPDGLVASDDRAHVRAALGRLDPEDREILTLKYLNDLPYAEIALRLGIPKGTVMSRLYHARQAFRREFRALANDPH